MLLIFAACSFAGSVCAQTRTLRIVTYNIEDDIDGATTPLEGLITPSGSTNVLLGGVLEGIGEEFTGSDAAQPFDVLALEETTSNPVTVAPIVNGLNAFYNAPGMYAQSPYQGKESGNDAGDGNGPNAMVYNTTTLQLLASVGVDPPVGSLGSSTGELREVVRYEFAPAGVTPSAVNEFYVYVSHYKSSASGSETTDETEREGEAVIIRNDEANNLPANARVLYVGDYNITTSGEASYQTMLAADAPNGIAQGQGVDVYNLSAATNINWGASSLLNQKSDSDTSLRYRDDLEVMTTNIYNATPGGLAYVTGTYHTFANNGSVAYEKSANSGANTSLNSDLGASPAITAAQLYQDITTASDHYPVVADYTIPIPPTAAFNGSPASGVAPLTVTFTDTSAGSITNWFWNFGDGASTNVTTNTVLHTYTNAGVYSVTEVVSSIGGSGTNTQANYITVLTPPPVASFSGVPTNGIVPLTVTFMDNSTGEVTNRFWDFGDGTTTNDTSASVMHTYTNAGVYGVTEIVSGIGGSGTNTQANYITATNLASPPVTTFQISSITVSNQTLTLSWQTAVGGTYDVQTSFNLTTWLPLVTNLTAAGTNLTLTTNTSFSPQFFRIQREN